MNVSFLDIGLGVLSLLWGITTWLWRVANQKINQQKALLEKEIDLLRNTLEKELDRQAVMNAKRHDDEVERNILIEQQLASGTELIIFMAKYLKDKHEANGDMEPIVEKFKLTKTVLEEFHRRKSIEANLEAKR